MTALDTPLQIHPNAGLMLGQRLRRWLNIKPTLVQRLVLSVPSDEHLLPVNPLLSTSVVSSRHEMLC